jgi:hypothetical protein
MMKHIITKKNLLLLLLLLLCYKIYIKHVYLNALEIVFITIYHFNLLK